MNGTKLKELRKNNNLTQKNFCEIFKIAQPTLSLWENGEREPDCKTLKDIANFFNVSLDFLMDNEENIKENELTKLERILNKEDKERLITVIKAMFPNEYKEVKKNENKRQKIA